MRRSILELLQERYYAPIERGEVERAVEALHADVRWSHARVWGGRPGDEAETLTGRGDVERLLASRREAIAGLAYRVDELAAEGGSAGFIGHVEGPDGERRNFIGWLEVRDGLIWSYAVRPL
jgi:hypothetical protein